MCGGALKADRVFRRLTRKRGERTKVGVRDGAAGDLRNSRIGAKNIFIPSNADSLSTCGLQCRGGLARDEGAFAKNCKGCRLWPSA